MVIAHDESNSGWYEAHTLQCGSCAARESATQGDGKTPYKPAPGEKVYTTLNAADKAAAQLRRQASRR
ncbi:hypothetical protein [Pseudarthrobacter sp. MEB009]|uniref:hypothetical protein n=1 Tax=Pseudarthrobacter sp. MEB009 TaxID=3040326 RepID=UPI0025560957|nr:hypothetical protein [Pseudarthrobacter sp. MEB009]